MENFASPCLRSIDTRMGVSVGTFFKDFDSWDEAKTYFLQERRNEERLTKKPILEIQAGQERIAFSDSPMLLIQKLIQVKQP